MRAPLRWSRNDIRNGHQKGKNPHSLANALRINLRFCDAVTADAVNRVREREREREQQQVLEFIRSTANEMESAPSYIEAAKTHNIIKRIFSRP
jgi:hypothetical protein